MKKGKAFRIKGTLTTAIIGDDATVTGLLLTGMGERTKKGETNFLTVDKDTTLAQIEAKFRSFLERDDIGIILINQHIAEEIRNLIAEHEAVIPTILEIPSKDYPYDTEKDSILVRAARNLFGADNASEKLRDI